MRALLAVVVATLGAGCGRIGLDPHAADAKVRQGECPSGMLEIAGAGEACIESAERGNAPWTEARDTCAGLGRRLCTATEWAAACAGTAGLIDMADDAVPEWEWLAAEDGGIAEKGGYAACDDTGTHPVVDPYDYRCCRSEEEEEGGD
jgi:hypothetical protein